MIKTDLSPVPISPKKIEDFLKYLKRKDRSDATLRKYALDLKSFYNFLPEGKILESDSLPKWKDSLLAAGFAERTINTRIAACNSFLSYLRRKNWQVSPVTIATDEPPVPISIEEYYRLLIAARQANKEWLYFLIKTFRCMGLSVSELPFLTIEALVAGKISIVTKSRNKDIYIPEILRDEFLQYANRASINSGTFFKSPVGESLTRTYIMNELQSICEAANVAAEKVSPKSLNKLYSNTYSFIRSTATSFMNNEYTKIMEEENHLIGWDNVAI